MTAVRRRTRGVGSTEGSGWLNAAEFKGVDSSGKTDSTTGLNNSYQEAINRSIGWFLPQGEYLVGEAGKGFSLKGLEYKTIRPSGNFQLRPPQILCDAASTIRGHPNIAKEPVVSIQPPTTRQFIGANFKFGAIHGPTMTMLGETKIGSKILKLETTGENLSLLVGQKVFAAVLPAATKLTSIINSTEVEVSENATASVEKETLVFGPEKEGAALYMGPGFSDGTVFVQVVEEAKDGVLCEASTEHPWSFVANSFITIGFATRFTNALRLESPSELPATNPGVEGNRFFCGEFNSGVWGIVIDKEAGLRSRFNNFTGNVIEVVTSGCIEDNSGFSNIQYGVLSSLTGGPGTCYVLNAAAKGTPYVRAFMETTQPTGIHFTAKAGQSDIIDFSTKIRQEFQGEPLHTGNGLTKNNEGRPAYVTVQFKPKATKLSSEVKTTEKVFKLSKAEELGWIKNKVVTFSRLPGSVTNPIISVPYYIIATSSTGFELSLTPGGAAITVEGANLTTAETEFSTPNLHYQLTSNSEVGTTLFNMKEAKLKGFTTVAGASTFEKLIRFLRVTPGATEPQTEPTESQAKVYFITGSELSPTAETPVGETKINFVKENPKKEKEANKRFPNGTEVEFTKLPEGVTSFVTKKNYFVVETSTEGFKLSATEGGAAITVEGAALTTAGTKMARPNAFEVSKTSGTEGTPAVIAGAKIEPATTEITGALVSIDGKWQRIEGEGTFTIPLQIRSEIGFGIYQSTATVLYSYGT